MRLTDCPPMFPMFVVMERFPTPFLPFGGGRAEPPEGGLRSEVRESLSPLCVHLSRKCERGKGRDDDGHRAALNHRSRVGQARSLLRHLTLLSWRHNPGECCINGRSELSGCQCPPSTHYRHCSLSLHMLMMRTNLTPQSSSGFVVVSPIRSCMTATPRSRRFGNRVLSAASNAGPNSSLVKSVQ